MSFRIVPLVKGTGPLIALYRPILLIGRHPDCDIRIDSPKISRRHCCIATAYDRILIRDLGSRNGVRVNGRPQEEVRLQPGDELAIGPFLFRLEEEIEQAAPPRPVGVAIASTPAPAARAQGPGASNLRPSPPDSDIDLVPLDDI